MFNTTVIVASLGVGILIITLILLVNSQFFARLIESVTLWTADQATLVKRFSNFNKNIPSNLIRRKGKVFEIQRAESTFIYPDNFVLASTSANSKKSYTMPELFSHWGTTGFILVRNGMIHDEQYFMGHSEDKKWMSFSASKTLVGLLTALAYEQGYINSLDDTLSKYAPQFEGTVWEKVTFVQALNMTTGVKWDEDNISLTSDLVEFSVKTAFGVSFDDFLITMSADSWEAGSFHNYSSMDTQALGVAVSEATGKSLSAYLEETIWSQLGAEDDAFWITDQTGREMALSGWNAVLGDYARLGMLLIDGKNYEGKQLIPESWINHLINPDPEFLSIPEFGLKDFSVRSWLQAFVPKDGYGDFAAVGTYGQTIYVNPKTKTVIATHSVDPNIDSEDILEDQFYVFRTISELGL